MDVPPVREPSPTFFIVHGLDGSPHGHWQRWLERELLNLGYRVQFPDFPSKEAPHLLSWIEPLHTALSEAGPDVTVIAHSLGAFCWMQYASLSHASRVGRVLLVAPPGMAELDGSHRITGHRLIPLKKERIGRAAQDILIAGSLNDPYCMRGFIDEYAVPLDLPRLSLPDRFGHVNIESGHGPWPFALYWSLAGIRSAAYNQLNPQVHSGEGSEVFAEIAVS